MSKPLVISDCDEVLLHMVVPFAQWLDEAHGVSFEMRNDFSQAVRYKASGELLEPTEIWKLLGGFFDTEMHRQYPISGAIAGINRLAECADVVILTNLADHRAETRTRQLARHGVNARVFTNQGPKGPALQAILAEYRPSRAVFIDDIANHLGSVAETAPAVQRLHLCGEPSLAPHITCAFQAGHAHARIDDWASALPWLLERIEGDAVV